MIKSGFFLTTTGTINGKLEDEGRQDGNKEGLLIALSLLSVIAGRFLLSGLVLGYLGTLVESSYGCPVLPPGAWESLPCNR